MSSFTHRDLRSPLDNRRADHLALHLNGVCGDMYVHGNTDSQDLAEGDTFYAMSAFDTSGEVGGIDIDLATSTFTVTHGGLYRVETFASLSIGSGGAGTYQFSHFINGGHRDSSHVRQKMTTGQGPSAVAFGGFERLSSDDVVSTRVLVEGAGGAEIVVEYGNFSIWLVGA